MRNRNSRGKDAQLFRMFSRKENISLGEHEEIEELLRSCDWKKERPQIGEITKSLMEFVENCMEETRDGWSIWDQFRPPCTRCRLERPLPSTSVARHMKSGKRH